MATAIAPATTRLFDPSAIGLGAETEPPRFSFGEVPFGAILRAPRAYGCVYAIYTTEHTTDEYLDEMWAELPHCGLLYYAHTYCRKVPPDFARQANRCYIHYYATHKRGILFGVNKTQFLAAQGVLRL